MSTALSSADLVYFTERGSGPPLLLIHGLMVTGEMFEPVMDYFAARHRVIVPDLRGHGRSRGLPPPYTAGELAFDLRRLFDHLNIGTADILGYSQGGAIAQQLVLDHPRLCKRLVLACTYAYNMGTTREWIEGHLAPILIRLLGMRRLADLVVSQSMLRLDKERANWLADLIASQEQSLMQTAWKETMAFDSRWRLGEIHCPTLVVAGSNDQAVPFHHAKMLQEGIPGSQLAMIDGADHALIWTHTDEFARVTEEFLEKN